jgi:N utilization substance protein A
MLQDFKEKLDIEEVIAQILIMNNFKTVDDIALANLENLAQIEYFDEEIASELQNRALEYIYEQEQEMIGKIEDNLKELIIKFDNEDQDLLKLFAEKGIFFLKDLAELDIEELLEKFDDSCEEIPEDLAEELIVSARKLSDFKI